MKRKKVLIVEDDFFIYLALRTRLETAGFEVLGEPDEAVDNYEQAIALIENDPPHFAVLDIVINGEKDGLDVAEYLHKGYNTFLYVFTSTKLEEDRDRAARLSVIDWKLKTEADAAPQLQCIPKPFDANYLCERLLFDQKKMPEPFPLVKTGVLFLSRFRKLMNKEEAIGQRLQLDFNVLLPCDRIYSIESMNNTGTGKSNKPSILIKMEDGSSYQVTRSLTDILTELPAYIIRFNKTTVYNILYFTLRDAENEFSFFRNENMPVPETIAPSYREEARKRLRLVFHGF